MRHEGRRRHRDGAPGESSREGEELDGNLLLLSLPDEENLSAGMRAATLLMKDLKARFGLDYRLMINTEPHTRLEPGTGVLYEGSLGKIMPLVYVKGQAAHVSQIFNGFNPLLLLAEIVRRTELNPDFLETSGASRPCPRLAVHEGPQELLRCLPAPFCGRLSQHPDPREVPQAASGSPPSDCPGSLRSR